MGVLIFFRIFVIGKIIFMTKKNLLFTFIFLITINLAYAEQQVKASYYSNKLQGRHTSDGGKYHPDSLTCAHRYLPFGTILKVVNPKNEKEVIVKVTDRGPFSRNLSIDLSYSAAKELDIIRQGIASVQIIMLNNTPLEVPCLIPIPTPMIIIQNIKVIINKFMDKKQTSD